MFSKADRFKDKTSDVPPPGSYDVKSMEIGHRSVQFDKTSSRFNHNEESDIAHSDDSLSLTTPRKALCKTPGATSRPKSVTKSDRKKPQPLSSEQTRILELEKELKKILAERNNLSRELLASRQDVTKLEGKVQGLMRDKSALQAQIASLQKQNQFLSRGKSILQAKAENSVDARRAASLQSELQQAHQKLTSNKRALRRLNVELMTSTKELQESLLTALEEKEDLEERVEQLESEVDQARAAMEQQVCEFKESEEELKTANSSLQQRLEESQRSCEEQDAQLMADRQQYASDKQSFEEQLRALEVERGQLLSESTTAKAQVTELTATVSELQQQLRDEEDKVNMVNKEKETLKCELATVGGKLVDLEREQEMKSIEHHEALKSMTDKCLTFENKLAQEKRTHRENQAVLQSQLLTMEVSSKEQAKECKKWMQEYHKALNQIKTEEAETGKLRAKIERMKKECEESEELHRTNLQQVLAIAEELKEKEISVQNRMEELKRHCQQELTEKDTQLHEVQDKAVSLQRQLEEASAVTDTDAAVVEAAAVEELQQRLLDSQERLSRQQAHSSNLESEMTTKISGLEEELKKTKAEKDEVQRLYSEMEERFRPYQDQLDHLEDLNKLLKSRTALAEKEAEKFGEEYSRLLGHQNQRQKIQHVKKLKDDNSKLKHELTQYETEIQRLKRVIRRMEEEKGSGKQVTAAARPFRPKN